MHYLWNMEVYQAILKKGDFLVDICKSHSVKYLYAFGSATNPNFDPNNSDIDLLVDIDEPDPLTRGEKLLSLWNALEDFFGRRVDLLTESALKNPYLRKSIRATQVLIYDGERIKVSV